MVTITSTSVRAIARVVALASFGTTLAASSSAAAQEAAPVAAPPLAPASDGDGSRIERRAVPELYVTGGVLLGSAWAATLGLTAGLAPRADAGRATGLAAIPVVGPWAMLGSNFNTLSYTGALVTSGIAQAAGLGLLVAGLVVRRDVKVPALATAHVRVTFVPTAAGAAVIGVF